MIALDVPLDSALEEREVIDEARQALMTVGADSSQ